MLNERDQRRGSRNFRGAKQSFELHGVQIVSQTFERQGLQVRKENVVYHSIQLGVVEQYEQ